MPGTMSYFCNISANIAKTAALMMFTCKQDRERGEEVNFKH